MGKTMEKITEMKMGKGIEKKRKYEKWKPFEIRTDLAVEAHESYPGDGGEIAGVRLSRQEDSENGIVVTEVEILNEKGAEAMGKPMGLYITLEAPGLSEKDEGIHKEVSIALAKQIRTLMRRHHVEPEDAPSVLVVGLGNMAATPDSLGPRVMENLQVTRHLSLEYGAEFCKKNGYPILSGLTPGVMAQTGMETAEIVHGVVKEVHPALILVVDALAARSARRLGVTIQLSDTGIHPGAGVGNYRSSMTEANLHVPVLALGVPTVISAAAVVHDTVGALVSALRQKEETESYGTDLENMEAEEQYELIREVLEPEFGPMYVTPHDIDERVKNLSYTISEAIHEALFVE